MTYLFVDVETPGLDPSLPILEIAWLLTDNNLNIIGTPRTFVVDTDRWDVVWSAIRENTVVRDMHRESELIDAIMYGTLTPSDDVVDTLVADLKAAPEEGIHLAGFSVGFDRAFMEANGFGALFNSNVWGVQFHHRLLDLSAVKLMYATAGLDIPVIENPKPHRALPDVYEALHFARAIATDLRVTVGAS